jgi:hypothetical protein
MHITVSSLLGVGYGTLGAWSSQFSGVEGALAGCLTGVAGMLPDLDSESGRPVREVFGVTAAIVPMVMIRRLEEWGGNSEGAMLLAVLIYVSIRYGAGLILGMMAVHRGMFHSIPTLLIFSELTFLGFKSDSNAVKLLMAVGVGLGFASHLVLDEIYSVTWTGVRIKLKSSAGSAMKMFGKNWAANIFTYSLLFTLSYATLVAAGLLADPVHAQRPPQTIPNTADREVAPLRQR